MALFGTHTDEQLLELLKDGDEQAFDELYTRLWKMLFAIAYGHLRDTPAAEDIVHDVFTSLWINRRKVEAGNIRNYLAVSVKYSVLRKVRRDGQFRQYQRQETLRVVPDTTTEQALQAKYLLERYQREVARLPEQCRIVFQAQKEQDLSIAEIASALNISPNTVKNHLQKAVKTLRYNLKGAMQSLFSFFL